MGRRLSGLRRQLGARPRSHCSKTCEWSFLPQFGADWVWQGNDRIDTWRHNFATTAITVLAATWHVLGYTTITDKAAIVEDYMDGTDKSRAFYYREYVNAEGVVEPKVSTFRTLQPYPQHRRLHRVFSRDM